MYLRWRKAQSLKGVPMANMPCGCVFGVVPQFLKNQGRLHHWRDEATRGLPISKLLGPVWDPNAVILVLRDPSLVRHILKDGFDKTTKPSSSSNFVFLILRRFLGEGIFTLQHGCGAADGGALWMQQRKIAANIFSRKNFNTKMAEVFIDKATLLRDRLECGKLIDMQKQFFNLTMDSVMDIFFGEESDIATGRAHKYGEAFDLAHQSFFKYSMGSQLWATIAEFLPWPFGGKEGLCLRVHQQFSGVYRSFVSSVAVLDAESHRIIERCRADPLRGQRRDLMALFMQALEQEDVFAAQSVRYLRDVVLNFVIAGRDTTACTLSWMFFILGTHPGIQERVAEEIHRCLPAGQSPTLAKLHHSNMPLLHALLYETLRLHPPVPVNVKESSADDVLPDGTRAPAGVLYMYLPWAMGRDPANYEDPEVVRLERWVPFKQPAPHEFPVFQAGPRICVGMDMAIFEAKLVACILLQEFSFTLASGEEEKIHYSNGLTMCVCNSREQDSYRLLLVPCRRRQHLGVATEGG